MAEPIEKNVLTPKEIEKLNISTAALLDETENTEEEEEEGDSSSEGDSGSEGDSDSGGDSGSDGVEGDLTDRKPQGYGFVSFVKTPGE